MHSWTVPFGFIMDMYGSGASIVISTSTESLESCCCLGCCIGCCIDTPIIRLVSAVFMGLFPCRICCRGCRCWPASACPIICCLRRCICSGTLSLSSNSLRVCTFLETSTKYSSGALVSQRGRVKSSGSPYGPGRMGFVRSLQQVCRTRSLS